VVWGGIEEVELGGHRTDEVTPLGLTRLSDGGDPLARTGLCGLGSTWHVHCAMLIAPTPDRLVSRVAVRLDGSC
jgi:hypothetical protein